MCLLLWNPEYVERDATEFCVIRVGFKVHVWAVVIKQFVAEQLSE